MKDHVIVHSNEDGEVHVTIPATNVYVRHDEDDMAVRDREFATFDVSEAWGNPDYRRATIDEIAERDVPEDRDCYIVHRDDMPQDRHFRNAWQHDKGDVSVNMNMARDIHRNNLRVIRATLMPALDTDYMRADEAGDAAAKKVIAQRKQALRDITKHPDIAAAKTPEALKKAALTVLGT